MTLEQHIDPVTRPLLAQTNPSHLPTLNDLVTRISRPGDHALVPKFTEKFLVSNFDENVHIDSSRYALSGGDVYLRQLLESAP